MVMVVINAKTGMPSCYLCGKKKGMDITLKWDWLKYDIDQETMKAGKCIITGDVSGDLTAEAQTDDSEFDIDYCKRKVTEGCLKAEDTLHKFFRGLDVYADGNVINLSSDNTLLHNAEEWVISLDGFGDRRNVDSKLLAGELHQYVILYVLQEWCKIALPQMEKDYLERFAAEDARIRSIIYRKKEPKRP